MPKPTMLVVCSDGALRARLQIAREFDGYIVTALSRFAFRQLDWTSEPFDEVLIIYDGVEPSTDDKAIETIVKAKTYHYQEAARFAHGAV